MNCATASRETWAAIGTTVTVLTVDPAALAEAVAVVRASVEAIDAAASRFRSDSELSRVNAAAGRPVDVSPLLLDAIDAALDAARDSDGALDPTVGDALVLLGYDRDFADVLAHPRTGTALRARRARGPASVHVDRRAGTVCVERGVRLDLGATAKALIADRAAAAAHAACGSGLLVNLGGDIAVAGPPPAAGWVIRVADDHAASVDAPGQTITIWSGGLATSSITVRRWQHAGRMMHHLVDPSTGEPVTTRWRTVSAAAATCLTANTASTGALLKDAGAPTWLERLGVPARLVDHAGTVRTIGGWPREGGST